MQPQTKQKLWRWNNFEATGLLTNVPMWAVSEDLDRQEVVLVLFPPGGHWSGMAAPLIKLLWTRLAVLLSFHPQ